MSFEVEVEVTRSGDASDLVEALAARGLRAELDERSGEVVVRTDDVLDVQHAVEDWATEQGLPFVPYLVDDHRVVLTPPSS